MMQLFCQLYASLFLLIVSLPFTAPFSPLCHLPEYTRCCGAKHPLGLQQCQTEGSGGGEGRENDKHEQGGILGAAKNSTQKRRGERWRVCRHDDKRNTGWVIFRWFKNEMFCSQKRRGALQQLSARSSDQTKHRLFLI